MFSNYQWTVDGFIPRDFLNADQYNCYLARANTYKDRFPWSETLRPLWHQVLLHTSSNTPGKIAYFSSVENLLKNRSTQTSPEMFLQRFLYDSPSEIKEAWSIEVLGKVLPEIKFVPNTNPQGWYDIYRNGPHSCMKGSERVMQYAHPDNNLALAYVEEDGKPVQRTIVNQETKKYIRIFGSSNNSFMAAALRKLGYKQDDECLLGQIINVEYGDCSECEDTFPIGPYFDGEGGGILIDKKDTSKGIIGLDGEDIYYDSDFRCTSCQND